jgi:nitrogen fixation/metabolism regulation signal transduction histidine kinase
LYRQMNGLTESLAISRQSEQELLSVLEKVVSEINVAIIVFDPVDRIRLANQQASVLLKASAEALIGKNCTDTVLANLPISADTRIVDFRFPGAEGRWQIKQNSYRHQGKASRIMFIADLKQALSDQEIMAWQRLTRVISHEVNNSLTPIISLCQTLTGMLTKTGSGNEGAVTEGLVVIGERAKGLQKFIAAYARLARLPAPNKVIFPASDLAVRLKRIFCEQVLEIAPFPDVAVFGDVVQLEQALINLIKNGLEADPSGLVQLGCRLQGGQCEFQILDRGPGISNLENLFVPFYTTKLGGAGIGLVLCRQIAAGHHGHVSLENRPDGVGAVATLVLPLPPNE